MTWPLTFSSPPTESVDAYLEKSDEVGWRILEKREMGEARGSWKWSVKLRFKLAMNSQPPSKEFTYSAGEL